MAGLSEGRSKRKSNKWSEDWQRNKKGEDRTETLFRYQFEIELTCFFLASRSKTEIIWRSRSESEVELETGILSDGLVDERRDPEGYYNEL